MDRRKGTVTFIMIDISRRTSVYEQSRGRGHYRPCSTFCCDIQTICRNSLLFPSQSIQSFNAGIVLGRHLFFSCLSSRLFFLFGCFMKRVTEERLVHILNLFPLNTQTLTFAQTKRSSVCLRVCQKRCCSKRSWSRRTTTSS